MPYPVTSISHLCHARIHAMDIKNNTFVVTGGARGLGFAIASSLAEHGARVALIDLDEAELTTALDALSPWMRLSVFKPNMAPFMAW